MRQFLNILLVMMFTFTNVSFAQTKVDGSLLKGDVIGGTAANNRRIIVPKDTKSNLDAKTRAEGNLLFSSDSKKLWVDNGTSLVPAGGSGGGGVNYAPDGDAESASASIFIPYADAAGTRPVDGTGGSPNVTTSITSTSPIDGLKSFLLTKDAVNRQGQGWSAPFTVPFGYRAKASKITVQYIVNSGTFVAGSSSAESDVIWYLYDVTNSTLIEPSTIKMFSNSTSIVENYQAEFQTSATGSSYRLIAHVQSTSALAYELKVDNISVAPSQYVYAAPITDWIDYTPTITANSGSLTNYTLSNTQWSRVGASLYIKGKLVFTGSPGTWNLPRVSIPSGLVIDNGSGSVSSGVLFVDTGTNTYGSDATLRPGTSFVQFETYRGTAAAGVLSDPSQAAPFTWVSADEMHWMIGPIKIVGWSSNTQVSDGYDAREVSFNVSRTTNLTGLNPNGSNVKIPIGANVISLDTVNGWNAFSNRYDIKTSGVYDFDLQAAFQNSNVISGQYYNLVIYKNGSLHKAGAQVLTTTSQYLLLTVTAISVPCLVNDYIEAYIFSSGNNSVSTLTATNISFAGNKHQAPTTISATETIAASFSGGTMTAGSGAAYTGFSTKIYDTHNMVNLATGEVKVPINGFYRVSITSIRTVSAGNTIYLYKNGTLLRDFYTWNGASVVNNGGVSVDLKAGDILTFRPNASVTLNSIIVDIERIK